MRKSLLAPAALLLAAAAGSAAEVTLLSFNPEQRLVTVREGEEQRTYRLTDATKFYGVDPDGNAREMTYDDAVKGLGSEKSKGRLTFAVEARADEVAEARFRARKRK